jgi:hypothetical protein
MKKGMKKVHIGSRNPAILCDKLPGGMRLYMQNDMIKMNQLMIQLWFVHIRGVTGRRGWKNG